VIRVTECRLFLDSSVWLGYFLGNIAEAKEIVDSEENTLFTSIISIHEISKRLKKLGKTEKETRGAIKFIEDNSIIVNLNRNIALAAAENCEKYGLHTIDSLIYTSALEIKAEFVTAGKDFSEAPKTKIIKI